MKSQPYGAAIAILFSLLVASRIGHTQSSCTPNATGNESDSVGSTVSSSGTSTLPLHKSISYTITWSDGGGTDINVSGTGEEGWEQDCGGSCYVYTLNQPPIQCWPQFMPPTSGDGTWEQDVQNRIAQLITDDCEDDDCDGGICVQCYRDYVGLVKCQSDGAVRYFISDYTCSNSGCEGNSGLCPDGWYCNCDNTCAPLGVAGAACPCGDADCSGSLYCNCNGQCAALGGVGASCPCGDADCAGSLQCVNGTCSNGNCTTDDDCPGGLVCVGGTCGCSDSCDDPSCTGYNVCNCVGTCASSSCPGYNPCTCQ
jgi:hypothetical protein